MAKIYSYNLLSPTFAEDFEQDLWKLIKMVYSDDFKEYLWRKCQTLLEDICAMNFPIPNEYNDIENEYMGGMKAKIGDDYIYLYNDSEIDISSKNMHETTKAKYPAKLSLAQIVEYGIGFEGASSPYSNQVENWEYDVNRHGANGWYYKDEAGNIFWTDGFQGRFIFYKLKENVAQFAEQWISEYIEKNL